MENKPSILEQLHPNPKLEKLRNEELKWKTKMDEAEVKQFLADNFAEVIASKNKGTIMKAVMPALKGKADGKLINEIVAELCK